MDGDRGGVALGLGLGLGLELGLRLRLWLRLRLRIRLGLGLGFGGSNFWLEHRAAGSQPRVNTHVVSCVRSVTLY